MALARGRSVERLGCGDHKGQTAIEKSRERTVVADASFNSELKVTFDSGPTRHLFRKSTAPAASGAEMTARTS